MHEPGGIIDIRESERRGTVATAERAEPTREIVLAPPPPPPPPEAPKSTRRESNVDVGAIVSRGLTTFSLIVAAMLLFLFVFSGFAEARTQVGLQRRFAADIDSSRAPTGGVIDNGVPIAQLEIGAIGLHQIVVQGTTSGVLRAGPGHLKQTPLPGQAGNAVIFGRRETYGHPFRRIGSLAPGDDISVWTQQGKHRYIVDTVRTTPGRNGSELATTTGRNQLTLVTSDPAFTASRRLFVQAHLVGKPFAPAADTTPVTRAELGLTGQTDGILSLVLWLEVLLMAAIGATWLWRRWTRWSAYLVCVPVVLAVGWIVFENVTKLLPATL